MLNRFFGPKTHDYLHVLGVSGVAFGLPMNKVVMSISMMFILLNLLLEGAFKSYYLNWRSNKLFLLILGFFLLHIIAIGWSSNIDYALNDLRVKLPFLVIPLSLIAKPVKLKNHLNFILLSFLGALVFTSLLNFGFYHQWFGNKSYDDIRGMSLFCSHVRYSLLISMGAGICMFHKFFNSNKLILVFQYVLLLWFVVYTYESQVLSGYISLFGVVMIAVTSWLWRYNKIISISTIAVVFAFTIFALFWIFTPVTMNQEILGNLRYASAEGNPYYHEPENISPETKKPIEINICDKELKREWEKVSTIPYGGRDRKNQLIRTTLIRYLSSMDADKDAVGFKELSKHDINKIENGCASIYCEGLLARAYGLKYQLINSENPNGHSLLQRMEYWKTGLQIAKSNLLIGIGTGDVQDQFDILYNRNDSILNPENRRRTHNMYLTVLLTFGIIGLFLFLWLHVEFIVLNFNQLNLTALSFIVIILLSYLVEDTLETQTGVTFFGLFYGLYASKIKA